MDKRRFWLPAFLAFALMSCSAAGATPSASPASTAAPGPGGHMTHQARHGGQLGMSETLHIEIASPQPGDYSVFLSDPAGDPLPLEGITLEVSLIDPAGNELLNLPASIADSGDHFVARGGATDLLQADVRVRVRLPDNAEPVEMDFTLKY